MPPEAATGLPSQLFFTSPSQRVAFARERFFDSGERPTGLVSEAVIQSWGRCVAARHNPRYPVVFEAVSRSWLNTVLERSRGLLQAAGDNIRRLEMALAGTTARVVLTDAAGVIVHVTAAPASADERVLRVAARLGVNLSEKLVGTNAPAVVVKTGEPVTVLGAEHYYECVHPLHCAAAPILDGRGRLAGVLDLTVEARPFGFDAAALVGVYATMIENRLLQAGAGETLVLQFQVCSSMLGSPLEALVGIDSSGGLAWHNGTAQRLLGLRRGPGEAPLPGVEPLFGASLAELAARCNTEQAAPLRLPNGLTVWLRARAPAAPNATGAAAPAAEAEVQGDSETPGAAVRGSATLNEATDAVIARTLAECGGNISRAARLLGVSRGLLYRHLQRS